MAYPPEASIRHAGAVSDRGANDLPTPGSFAGLENREEVIAKPRTPFCIGCGCTDLQACEGGCHWLLIDRRCGRGICSSCPGEIRRFLRASAKPRARRGRSIP